MDMDTESQLMMVDTGGTLLGHVIGGSVFLSFGLAFLLVSLKRSRELRPGESFTETHVPEKDMVLMKKAASVFIVFLIIGILGESIPGCYGNWPGATHQPGLCFFHQIFHMVMYFQYVVVCIVALLEACGRLPPDSWRAMYALANFLAFLMWEEHSHMKHHLTDGHIHHLLGVISLMQAVSLTYSVLHPQNLVMFIAGFGLCIFNGVWFITAGVNHVIPIPTHHVATIFVLEALSVTLLITVVAALFGKPNTGNYSTKGAEYDGLVGATYHEDGDDGTEESHDSV